MQFNPTPDLPPIPEEADTHSATPANDISIDDNNDNNTSLNPSSDQNQSLAQPNDLSTTNEAASFMETMETLFQDRPLSELVSGFLRGRRSEGRQESIGAPQNLPAAQPAPSETPQQQETVREEPLQTNDQTTTTQTARRPRQVVRNSRVRV